MKVFFVYNVDKGVFSFVADAAHKVFSPETYECNLCDITYTNIKMKKEWKEFIHGLPESIEPVFTYKNNFSEDHPGVADAFPIIAVEHNGEMKVVVPAEELQAIESLKQLISIVKSRIVEEHNSES